MRKLDTRDLSFRDSFQRFRRELAPRGDVVSLAGRAKTMEVFGEPLAPWEVVRRICDDVRTRGRSAVEDYTRRLDDVPLSAASLRVDREQLERAHHAASPEFLRAIRTIRDHVLQFQTAIVHQDVTLEPRPGVRLAHVYRPLKRVGICVPGGAAAYPSTILMTAVPAMAAGVQDIAIVTPPTAFGANHPDVLATCHELGITEVYRVGGAQGVGMLAYGVESVPRVDKIVGPGNLFVALAKKYVFGDVDIDSIAGPSEVVVLADDSIPAEFVAADLLAQAEHSPGSSVLVTWSDSLWNSIERLLEVRLGRLSRSSLTRASLEQFGALIRVRDRNEAVEIATELAPEHLQISTEDSMSLAERIPTAGAVFLGNTTPVALGDYVAGPSHVLPTGGTARFAHGLNANDFRRSHSIVEHSPRALAEIAPVVRTMALTEGLSAHWESVEVRLSSSDSSEEKLP